MFALFKRSNPLDKAGRSLYETCVHQSRNPFFYRDLGLEESFEQRFELLVLHAFLIIHRLEIEADEYPRNKDLAERLSQSFFDSLFKNLQITLREMGVGDVGVPKRMKKMMLGFNGRIHAYQQALTSDAPFEALSDALERNVFYYTPSSPKQTDVKRLCTYTQDNLITLKNQRFDDMVCGEITFKTIKE